MQLLLFCFLCVVVVIDVLVAVLFVIMANSKSVMMHRFIGNGRGESWVMGWGRITIDWDNG